MFGRIVLFSQLQNTTSIYHIYSIVVFKKKLVEMIIDHYELLGYHAYVGG